MLFFMDCMGDLCSGALSTCLPSFTDLDVYRIVSRFFSHSFIFAPAHCSGVCVLLLLLLFVSFNSFLNVLSLYLWLVVQLCPAVNLF